MPSRNQASIVALLALALAAPGMLPAQALPAYAASNPMVQRRTGLATLPWIDEGKRWGLSIVTDYASSIEFADFDDIDYLVDAELLLVGVTATRRVGDRGFLLVSGSLQGAYDGFLDGFLDWYHDLLGITLPARDARPRNAFGYAVAITGEPPRTYESSGGFLGDVRLGAGIQPSRHFQAALSVTLPTGTGPEGFRRGVVSVNATSTLRSVFGRNAAFLYEGTLGAGYTPAHGDFKDLQQTLFLMITQGVRARVTGPFHLYANLIYHSALYHDTGTRQLDGRELSIDTGGIFRFKRGPEWILGLVEDLEPGGPAIDVGFRLGARW